MSRDRVPAIRAPLRGVIIVLVAALVFLAIGSDTSSGGESPATGEYLVHADPSSLAEVGLIVVRSVGFGWTLVKSPKRVAPGQTLGVTVKGAPQRVVPNVIYELFDEPLFDEQWALENTGQSGGTPGADIAVRRAWGRTTGHSDSVIAVIDTGIDLDHPDLVSRLWTNESEIPGNGLDDDGNGYVDDVHGWDAYAHDGDPDDETWHGTAVAGVAAAATNGVGISGVAPGATIMAVRACDLSSCPTSAIVEAIAYALDNGAHVLNLSLGSHTSNEALEHAVAAAGSAGAVIVAAVGNDGTDNDSWPIYPAGYPGEHIIAVAATDHDDGLAASSGWASNYGASSVDLGAPGETVLTTSLGGWTDASGTSFAAPHVTGVAALIRSLRPESTPGSVRELILRSVDSLPGLTGDVATGGRLNAGAAVDLASAPVAVILATPTTGITPFTVSLDGSASYDPQGFIVDFEWRFPDDESIRSVSTVWSPPDGVHIVELVVTDDDGFEDSTTVTIDANRAPTAVASGSPTLGWAPLLVSVAGDGSSDDDGSIIAWDWAAGSSTAVGEHATMLIPDVGEHEVVLTVTDNFGATGSDEIPVLVGFDFVDTRSTIFRLDIAWMSALGITKGCSPPVNDRYCPTGTVTREQMAAFLTRALHLPPTATDYFADDDGTLFEDDINRLAAAEITKGCNPPTNDHYCPTTTVTRQQMAAFLHRGPR